MTGGACRASCTCSTTTSVGNCCRCRWSWGSAPDGRAGVGQVGGTRPASSRRCTACISPSCTRPTPWTGPGPALVMHEHLVRRQHRVLVGGHVGPATRERIELVERSRQGAADHRLRLRRLRPGRVVVLGRRIASSGSKGADELPGPLPIGNPAIQSVGHVEAATHATERIGSPSRIAKRPSGRQRATPSRTNP